MHRKVIIVAVFALLVIPLWMVGEWRGLGRLFFEFPPQTRYVQHAPFSIPVFGLFTFLFLFSLFVIARPRWFGFKAVSKPDPPVARHRLMPVRGWIGLVLIAICWTLAWGRFDGVPPWIFENTFFPLWLGYILLMDGFTLLRSGDSLLSRDPVRFVMLFPASAIAWWYFEFVNRFVQNWRYAGVADYSAPHYIIMATISFSTVFPAIFVTHEWLSTFRWFQTAYRNGPRWPSVGRSVQMAWLTTGILALIAVARWPVPLFFLVWLAPLAVLAPGLAMAGVVTPFKDLQRGDYSRLFTLAVAALICGFFWELWNLHSLPKWGYAIPYVQALHLFEMPLPGYAGYLPFGPICWCMWRGMDALFKK